MVRGLGVNPLLLQLWKKRILSSIASKDSFCSLIETKDTSDNDEIQDEEKDMVIVPMMNIALVVGHHLSYFSLLSLIRALGIHPFPFEISALKHPKREFLYKLFSISPLHVFKCK